MSERSKKKNSRHGGNGKPDLAQTKIIALQNAIRQQNTLLVNLSAAVHQVQESVDLSEYSSGDVLLAGTADILAKAGLMGAIRWMPLKKEPN